MKERRKEEEKGRGWQKIGEGTADEVEIPTGRGRELDWAGTSGRNGGRE